MGPPKPKAKPIYLYNMRGLALRNVRIGEVSYNQTLTELP